MNESKEALSRKLSRILVKADLRDNDRIRPIEFGGISGIGQEGGTTAIKWLKESHSAKILDLTLVILQIVIGAILLVAASFFLRLSFRIHSEELFFVTIALLSLCLGSVAVIYSVAVLRWMYRNRKKLS